MAIGAGQAGQAAELSSGPAIHQDLVRDYGFDGGYSTVRRYVEWARRAWKARRPAAWSSR